MQPNTMLFRLGLSGVGGFVTAALGLVTACVWAAAVSGDLATAAVLGVVAGFIIGAVTVQLTPTGGVIMENRTTVNYALLATYAWIAALLSVLALIAFVLRFAFFS